MEATGPQTTPAGGEPLAAPRFSEDDLIRTGTDVLRALGAPGDTARVVATSLTLSNLVGHDSHGIVRLIQYSEWVKSGQIRPDGQPSVVSGRGAVSLPRNSPPTSASIWQARTASLRFPSVLATTLDA
jgi:hypothetical protein